MKVVPSWYPAVIGRCAGRFTWIGGPPWPNMLLSCTRYSRLPLVCFAHTKRKLYLHRNSKARLEQRFSSNLTVGKNSGSWMQLFFRGWGWGDGGVDNTRSDPSNTFVSKPQEATWSRSGLSPNLWGENGGVEAALAIIYPSQARGFFLRESWTYIFTYLVICGNLFVFPVPIVTNSLGFLHLGSKLIQKILFFVFCKFLRTCYNAREPLFEHLSAIQMKIYCDKLTFTHSYLCYSPKKQCR